MPACPVPGSQHGSIPEGGNRVEMLVNVVNHLAQNDRVYLEGRCKQVLADLGVVDVELPADYVDLTDVDSGGGTQ